MQQLDRSLDRKKPIVQEPLRAWHLPENTTCSIPSACSPTRNTSAIAATGKPRRQQRKTYVAEGDGEQCDDQGADKDPDDGLEELLPGAA
eukprot:1088908-Pyramimonas_sp.AAC.1